MNDPGRCRLAGPILGAATFSMLVLGSWACGGGTAPSADTTQAAEVTGALVGVESPSLLVLDSLDVRDAAGHVWHFLADGYSGFTPSHLREHMVQGLPVTVRYRSEDGGLVLVEVTD